MTHWHRRGTKQEATNADWTGWARYPCTDPDCDWAVYVSPTGRTRYGYIPSEARPGNTDMPPPAPDHHYPKRGDRIQKINGKRVDTKTGEIL